MKNSNFLHSPYPFEDSIIDRLRTILILSFLMGAILVLLQPYGFIATDRTQMMTAYLLIGTAVLLINYIGVPYVVPEIFEEHKWTILKAVLFFTYNAIMISLWYHIYNAFFIGKSLLLFADFTEILINTAKLLLIVGLAAGLLILIRYNVITRKNLENAQDLNISLQGRLKTQKQADHDDLVVLTMEGSDVEISRDEIRFIRAEGNYIGVHSIDGDNEKYTLYRDRIKSIEEQLSLYPEFYRCHRSYIVNLRHVYNTRGNSRGLLLSLKGTNEKIPVSRSKIKFLLESMSQEPRKTSHT